MIKKYYKNVFVIYILCLYTNIKCQNINNIGFDSEPNTTLFSVAIKELDNDSISNIAYGGGYYSYKGSLFGGIQSLLDLTSDRIKINGIIPNKNIYFLGETVLPDINNIKFIILNTLSYQYKFKIEDSVDSCEVWAIYLTKNSSIPIYSEERDGLNTYARPSDDKKNWLATGIPISILKEELQSRSQQVVVDKIQNDKQYNLVIPYHIMPNFHSLKIYLKEKC